MKNKCIYGFWGILFISFVYLGGCTSVSGNVESSVSFSKPILVDDLIVGSFTYNINDIYIVRPDNSLILEAGILDKKGHEAYYEQEVIGSNGKPRLKEDGTPLTRTVMKNDYHIASYDELYSWAIRSAAENAKITHIIAIKSFLTTTTKNVAGLATAQQNVTLTVYGEGGI